MGRLRIRALCGGLWRLIRSAIRADADHVVEGAHSANPAGRAAGGRVPPIVRVVAEGASQVLAFRKKPTFPESENNGGTARGTGFRQYRLGFTFLGGWHPAPPMRRKQDSGIQDTSTALHPAVATIPIPAGSTLAGSRIQDHARRFHSRSAPPPLLEHRRSMTRHKAILTLMRYIEESQAGLREAQESVAGRMGFGMPVETQGKNGQGRNISKEVSQIHQCP